MTTKLQTIEIPGVTCPGRSVLYCEGDPGRTPVLLVHGIIDSVRRWISRNDEVDCSLSLSDYASPPIFDLDRLSANAAGRFPELWNGPGLLNRLATSGFPAVAFTYQGGLAPIADMDHAVATLHRLVDWSCRHWDVRQVDLVGHSRGGLVIRHSLQIDSEVLSAETARRSTRHVVCLASPFQGSRLAEMFSGVQASYAILERSVDAASAWFLKGAEPSVRRVNPLGRFVLNISQLCPNSDEVRRCQSERLPAIAGEHFLIAGSDPTYFRCELNGLGTVRFPPAFPLPELTPGEGDLAVSVSSALDGGETPSSRQKVFPVNHVVTPFDRRVQDQVIDWLTG